MDDAFDRLKTALAGSYALERELGHGGMATVYLAQDLKHRRRVAIKVLRPELASALGPERFFHEIEVAARLQHPHIVGVLDSGRTGGSGSGVEGQGSKNEAEASSTLDPGLSTFFYYVMPYVEGETLRDRLTRSGELSVQEAVRILTEVADALGYAHRQGVVHRDMKPDNVMMSERHALVMDFGVAKAISEANRGHNLTTVGMALGTPAYMAPEQAAADPSLDHRVDIYALGVMGYELLTGRPPFSGMSAQQILAAQVTQAPEPLLARRPSCPPALAAAIMKCLEKRASDRWQSAEELLHQLEGLGTPTGGTTPTTAVPAFTAPIPAAASSSPRLSALWQRSGYLGLGVVLALLVAWGVMRPRGGAVAGGLKRVVVLPFENQGDSSRQYFANGVTEAITSQLAGIAGISVIPRSTAARYRGTTKSLAEIGKELGVTYVLEGTVQFEEVKDSAARVRVSPELIRVSDTSSVWAHGYDAQLASVFQVYSNVATEVARSLEVALNDPEKQALAVRPTTNAEAYDLYLRANDYLNRGLAVTNFTNAIPMLRRAVTLDPDFALAWGRLSEALGLSHWLYINRTQAAIDEAATAADKALALQPDLPEAHRAMGSLYYRRREYDQALAEFAKVEQRQPNSADLHSVIGYVYRRQGKWEESLAEFRKRIALDPGAPLGFNDVGETLNLMRRYPEAIAVLQHCIDIAPDEPDCYSWLASVQTRQDSALGPAQATLKRALSRMSANRFGGVLETGAWIVSTDDSLRRAFLATTSVGFGRTSADYYQFRGDLLRLSGHTAQGRVYYDSALAVLTVNLKALPYDYGWHQRMGQVLWKLGRQAEALPEGRRGVEMMPLSLDVYFGGDAIIDLARIYAAGGQAKEAVEQLKVALAMPSRISVNQLKNQPDWDPIRNDPEFKKLLQ